ncbi:hypothetical protein [Bacterioplanoides sp.]|uniref:hypothetical protein n=1 Tax=Bacterioplanoides sp. TaxID=2066072 RepID=UPI003AFFB5E4
MSRFGCRPGGETIISNLADIIVIQQHKQIPLITLAQELGYSSEAAFSRAFKRVMEVITRYQKIA